MLHIINETRRRQSSVTVTLIDMQNDFNEVHHNWIKTVLKYHFIPDDVSSIIWSLYRDFHIAILTNSFSSDYIKIKKSLLEGDCFSQLISNMVMNRFIQYMRNEFFKQFGHQFLKHFNPRNWLQFANDVAAITAKKKWKPDFTKRFQKMVYMESKLL